MAKVNNKPVMRSSTAATAAGGVPPAIFIPKLARNADQDSMAKALGGQPDSVGSAKPAGFRAAEIARAVDEYVVGNTYRLPLHCFQKSENNARVFYLPSELDEMSQSLVANGQDYPTLGYVRNGKIVLTDGQKRFQASANAGLFDLEVKIIETPESEADEYEASRRVNLLRSTQTGLDDAFKWRSLLDRAVYKSQDELARRLGLKDEKVSKILGITRIPERMIRMMLDHEKTSTWSVAYLISTIFDAKRIEELGADKVEELAQEIVEEVIKKELAKNQLEALISKKIQGPKKRAHAESMPVKFGEWKGELKIFPARGQLDMTFRGLPGEKINELKEAIEKVLAGQLPLS